MVKVQNRVENQFLVSAVVYCGWRGAYLRKWIKFRLLSWFKEDQIKIGFFKKKSMVIQQISMYLIYAIKIKGVRENFYTFTRQLIMVLCNCIEIPADTFSWQNKKEA